MEAGRAIAGGFVTPDRTTTIASTSRSYLVVEKMAMADGRYDQDRLVAAVEKNSQKALLLDLEAIAREAGAMINAVMLGAIAGAGALPIPAEAFEAAIRADGKAVDANLRGFRAGFDAAQAGSHRRAEPLKRQRAASASLADLERRNRGYARSGARVHDRRRAPARRLPGSRLRAALSRSSQADPRRRCEVRRRRTAPCRDGAASRGAHVVRGRDPRGAGQDRSGAHRPHCARTWRQAGADFHGHRVPQTRDRRVLLDPAAVAGAAGSWLGERHPAFGRAHWGMAVNTASIFGYLRFHLLAKLRRVPAQNLPLPGGAARDRGVASISSREPRRSRPSLRSRSPNAPVSSKAMATPTSAAAAITG